MGIGTFIQQNKTKNQLVKTNQLLEEQNRLLAEIRDLLRKRQ
jgi:large-conductance mechanosensitive channel